MSQDLSKTPHDELETASSQTTDVAFDNLPTPNQTKPVARDSSAIDSTASSEPNNDPDKVAVEDHAQSVDFDDLPAPHVEPPPAPDSTLVPFEALPAPTPAPSPDKSSAAQPLPQPTTVQHADFWLLLTLFITFRGLTLLLLKPGGFIRDWSDFDTYFGIAALSDYGLYPFLDFWLEWPPLLPWLAVGSYQLSLWLPAWPEDARLGFVIILGTIFLLFEIGNFTLIYRLGHRLWDDSATRNRLLWLYLGLFAPVYALLGFFDCIALFFILLALDLLLNNRRLPSAVAVGVGIMVKIIPILMMPVAARYLGHQHRQQQREGQVEIGLYAVTIGLTLAVLLAPFFFYGPEWLMASARSMLERSPWETVWAIGDGYYGFGQVGGDRFNAAETEFAVHEGHLPAWSWGLIALVFAGFYLPIFLAKADYDQPRNLIAFMGFTMTTFLLANKGYSPQFLVYLLPFIMLLFPNSRGLIYALILTALNILEQPIYFVLIPSASWLLTGVVFVRFGLLVLLAGEFLFAIWPEITQSAGVNKLYQQTPAACAALTTAALIILTPITLQAYSNHHQDNGPASTFIHFMQAQAKRSDQPLHLMLSDQATYQHLHPHLRHQLITQLAGGDLLYDGAAPFSSFLEGVDTLWFLPTGPQQATVTRKIDLYGSPLISYRFENFGTASLYDLGRQNVRADIALARFTGGIELVSYNIETYGQTAEVTLFWQTVSQQLNSLKVFTQILGADGTYVAGHDGFPNNGRSPTDSWPLNTIQMDRHVINLPAALPTDGVVFIAGLYNSNGGERLTATAPNGVAYPNRAVPLPLD